MRARAACTSPFAPAGDLADGAYTYTVWAVHNGDSSLAPLVKAFTVDTIAPTTALDPVSGPQEGSLLTIGTATFKFASSEAGTSQCSLDGAAFATCVSPLALSGLAPGVHSFAVRSLDLAGNLEAAPQTRNWTIFAPPPPQVVVVQGQNSATEQISAVMSFNFSTSGATTKLKTLSVKNVPLGSTVTVTCTKGACPSALVKKVKSKGKTKLVSKPLVFAHAFGTINLKKLIARPLKAGTVLTVLVAKPNAIGAVKVMTIRKRKAPLITTRCLPPGAKSPVSC